MEPECSSPHSQETATSPYPEPDRANLCPSTNLSTIYFNIILPSTPGPSGFPTKILYASLLSPRPPQYFLFVPAVCYKWWTKRVFAILYATVENRYIWLHICRQEVLFLLCPSASVLPICTQPVHKFLWRLYGLGILSLTLVRAVLAYIGFTPSENMKMCLDQLYNI